MHFGRTNSSLILTLELQLITLGQLNPLVKVDYAHVHEIVTGKLLALYQPLYGDQDFYIPIIKPGLSLKNIPWNMARNTDVSERSEHSNTPPPDSQHLSSDPEWHVTSEEMEEEVVRQDAWRGSVYRSSDHEAWLSLYDQKAEERQRQWFLNIFAVPSSSSSSTNEHATSSTPALSLATQSLIFPSHWILHPKLLSIPIYIEIEGGKHDTLQNKKAVSVVPDLDGCNTSVVRLFGMQRVDEIDPTSITRNRLRPNPHTEMGLMVVVRSEEQHIGKFVRRIYHFYKGTKSKENDWFILGVVEVSDGIERLTSERLELHPDDLEYTKETEEECRASKALFKEVREEAKKGRQDAEIQVDT
uniref:Uncharacterized protein n=1 Tax=Moniliophthora roreri TaxID=221103 RepID=A0A0W0G0T7_MONRR